MNLASFNVFSGSATWASIFPMLLTIIAVFAIGAMSKKKVKGAVLWGMLGGAVAYYAVGLITVPDFYASGCCAQPDLRFLWRVQRVWYAGIRQGLHGTALTSPPYIADATA